MPRARKVDPTAPSRQYGEQAAISRATAVVPMLSAPTDTVPVNAPEAGPPTITPDQVQPVDAPTDRPNEPITTGLPNSPGAGPEVLRYSPDPVRVWLQAAYKAFPVAEVRELMAAYDAETGYVP